MAQRARQSTPFEVILCVILAAVALASLVGCGYSGPAPSAAVVLGGSVHGGRQPVSGASIQLYAAGSSGLASQAIPLLSNAVQSDSSGNFSIPADYHCPSASSQVYVVARGGNPGLASGAQNPDLTLAAVLGSCSSLTSVSDVAVNEVTTVGSVWPLAAYMTSPTQLGSAAGDTTFTAAATSVPEFVNLAQGASPGTPTSTSHFAEASKLNTLADVLAACVSSTGGSAGDGSPCGQLFSMATPSGGKPPADTLTAALLIAQNPHNAVDSIYSLSSADNSFAPVLTAPPPDWTLTLSYDVATPSLSLPTGTYTGSQEVTITDATPGSTIFYTTDGTVPATSSTPYSGPIAVDVSSTLQAIAVLQGSTSSVASSTLTISALGTSAKLAFVQQPSNALAGNTISPAVTVQVVDAGGTTLVGATNAITLSLVGGTGLSGTLSVVPQNGIATFSGLAVGAAGTYTLYATSPNLSSATSASFTITAPGGGTPVPAKLAFLQQPTNAVAGATISPGVQVAVQDGSGNTVTTATNLVTIALTGGGALGGTLSATPQNGIATFSSLAIGTAGSYTLSATSAGLSSATSAGFTITVQGGGTPTPVKLTFVQQPTNAVAGATISPAVQVAVQDSNGTTVTGATNLVTLVLSGGGTLGGTVSATPQNGIATFSNLAVNNAGSYTLATTSPGLTSATSLSFVISAQGGGAPTPVKLTFVQQPTNAVAGATISPAVQVAVQDGNGTTVTGATNPVTLALSGGGALGGTVSATPQNGIATFSNLAVNNAGSYTLSATGPGLTSATSQSFTIAAQGGGTPTPVKLTFVQQPTNAVAGATISPAVQVAVQDGNGTTVTGATNPVTLALSGGGALGGSLTATPQNGIATFSNLAVSAAGNYTLSATSSSLTSATSVSFTIAAQAPTPVKLAFLQQPSNALTGATISPAVQVVVQDASGNTVTAATNLVTLALSAGGTLGGTLSAAPQNGIVTFSSLTVSAAGNYTLSATSASLTSATSSVFTISAPANTNNGTTILPSAPLTISAYPGGTFQVTYNWQAVPVAGQSSVFVDFIDSTGTVQFQDNTQPPVATSQWTGAVSYTHTVSVPATLATGSYKIVAGVTSPSGNISLVTGSGVTTFANGEYQVGTLVVSSTCSITSHGAVGDGVTDNATAIQNTFNYAATNKCIALIPAGTFAYLGSVTANGIAVSGVGAASILKPLSLTNASITLQGNGGSVSNLVMVSAATARLTTPWSGMIWVNNATNYYVENILINNSSSTGILSDNSNGGYILNNTIENTLADSITQVLGTYNVLIAGNRILNSGDDGVSNNTYLSDPGVVHQITVQGNTVLNNKWGRGLEVSGGSTITFTGNYVDNLDGYSDMYIASESEWKTQSVDHVTVSGNTFVDGGPNQGSVIVYNSEAGANTITGITVTGNQFVNPKMNAVQFAGAGSESGMVLQGNTDYSTNPFSTSSNPSATATETNNQVLAPSAYSKPAVAPGGGCSFSGC